MAVPKKKRDYMPVSQQKKIREDRYTYADVSRLLGVKRVALQEWMSLGYVTPDKKAQGQGTKNYYSKLNLIEIKLFRYFVDSGIVRREAARRVEKFRWAFDPALPLNSSDLNTIRYVLKKDQLVARVFPKGDKRLSENPMNDDNSIERVEFVNIGRIIDSLDKEIGG